MDKRLLNVPALSIQRMHICHLPTVSKPLSTISLGELGARLLPNHLSEEAHVITPDHPSTIISVSCFQLMLYAACCYRATPDQSASSSQSLYY